MEPDHAEIVGKAMGNEPKRILLTLPHLPEYRLAFIRQVREKGLDLVVFSGSERKPVPLDIPNIMGRSFSLLGLRCDIGIFRSILFRRFDLVCAEFDLRSITSWLSVFLCNRLSIPIVLWGIGISRKTRYNRLRVALARRVDAVLVYERDARSDLIGRGISKSRVFVLNNTVGVRNPSFNSCASDRKDFVFLGTLNSRKKLPELLEALSLIRLQLPKDCRLRLIGDGPERQALESLASALQIAEIVEFCGRQTDDSFLADVFGSALACISPGQAGLSILHSFAYGTGFIARKDAVSGGELANIRHRENGYLYSSKEELARVMCDLVCDPSLSVRWGRSAFNHYISTHTMEHMSARFVAAVQSVVAKNAGDR